MALPSYLNVPPRFGTLRNFNNPTYGDRMALTARLLGKAFLPHQQYMADVLGEVDPKTGIRVYREGYITLMRQGGKTTFVITYKSHRALDCQTPQLIQFAAQDGIEAKKKWLQHAKLIKRSPLGTRLLPGMPVTSNGKEVLEWDTGSTEFPLSGSEGSGHGDTVNAAVITEAFAHKDSRYIDTMLPAMNADPDAQLLVESTQGTTASIYLNEQTATLRDRETADPAELRASRIAIFDWSFGDDEDAGSPDTWRRRIPQLGSPLLRIEEVDHAWRNATTPKKVRAFKRGFGNVADLGAAESSLFNEDDWEDAETEEIIVGLRALTFDITNDRSWASLAWGGSNSAGELQAELIRHDRSTHWLVAAAGEIFDRNPKMERRVYCVGGGQAITMHSAFERAEIEFVVLSKADYAGAVGQYFDGISGEADDDGEPVPIVFHTKAQGQLPLHVAIGGASFTKTPPRVWDSANSTTIISPLVACSIAPWAYQIERDRQPVEDILQTFA